MDDAAAQRNVNQLHDLVEQTSSLSNELKVRVQNLQKQGISGRNAEIRKQQVCALPNLDGLGLIWCHKKTGLVKQKFIEAIQNYQQVEQQYRSKYKQRMERQFRIGLSS